MWPGLNGAKGLTSRTLKNANPVYSHCMRAILAGGGTGGHVIPAIAIAQQLQENYAAQVLFIGTARGIENRLVPAAGFDLRLVQVGALNRVSLTTRLKTIFDLPRAVWDSSRILSQFLARRVVIGVGGYASGLAMLAAIWCRIPTLVFEPNFVPGFANRLVAPMVSVAAVHSPKLDVISVVAQSDRRSSPRRLFPDRQPASQQYEDLAHLRRKPGRPRHQPGCHGFCSRPTPARSRNSHCPSNRRT